VELQALTTTVTNPTFTRWHVDHAVSFAVIAIALFAISILNARQKRLLDAGQA